MHIIGGSIIQWHDITGLTTVSLQPSSMLFYVFDIRIYLPQFLQNMVGHILRLYSLSPPNHDTSLRPICTLHGHQSRITSLDADDAKCVSGDEDGSVIVWDIADAEDAYEKLPANWLVLTRAQKVQ